MGPIVQLVISFELSLANGTPSSERSELKIGEIIGRSGSSGSAPRLGLMRLAALELLDKLHLCYSIRMLDVFREADLYTSILKFYALYPFNDIALRLVTNILAYAIDESLVKTLLSQKTTQAPAPRGRPSRILDLEPINQDELDALDADSTCATE